MDTNQTDPKQIEGTTAPVEETQVSPMPSEEQQLPQGEEIQSEGISEEDLALPDGVSDRTAQQFEKLKARLKEAEEKLAGKGSEDEIPNVFDYFRPKKSEPATQAPKVDGLSQQQVDNIVGQYIDEAGNVDTYGLNLALNKAQREATEAKSLAQKALERASRFEENTQTKTVHEKYPELNPANRAAFNRDAYEAIADRLLRQQINGEEPNFVKAADEIMRVYKPAPAPKRDEAKAVANSSGTTRSQPRQETVSDLEDLRERTRSGDRNAFYERMRRYEEGLKGESE